jgi:hypothetical protein
MRDPISIPERRSLPRETDGENLKEMMIGYRVACDVKIFVVGKLKLKTSVSVFPRR